MAQCKMRTGWLQPVQSALLSHTMQGNAKSGINNSGHSGITGFCQSRLDESLTGSAGGSFMCLRCVGVDESGPGGHCLGYGDHVPRKNRATYG